MEEYTGTKCAYCGNLVDSEREWMVVRMNRQQAERLLRAYDICNPDWSEAAEDMREDLRELVLDAMTDKPSKSGDISLSPWQIKQIPTTNPIATWCGTDPTFSKTTTEGA